MRPITRSGRRLGRSGRPESRAEGVGALEVVGLAHLVPFVSDLGQAAQTEAPKAPHFLDDAEDRFDRLLPQCVERTARSGGRAVAQVFERRGVRGGRERIGAFLQLGERAAVL